MCSLPLLPEGVELTVRLAVPGPLDGAAGVAQRAAEALRARGVDARCCFTGPGGPNNKVWQLERASAGEDAEVLVVADADVDLTGYALGALLAPLEDAGVGVSWAPPLERRPRTHPDHPSSAVLDASLHSFALLRRLSPWTLVGKLFALRASVLERLGGFRSLREHLGEDAELARRLRERGLRAVCVAEQATSLAQGRSARAVRARFRRWLWVVRGQRPALLAAYPLFFAPTLALCSLSLLAPGAERPALCLLALGLRWVLAALARSACGGAVLDPWLPLRALLADALLLCATVEVLLSRRLRWRASSLRVLPDGRILLEPEASRGALFSDAAPPRESAPQAEAQP